MEIPSASTMMERVRGLPAAAPLLEHLGEQQGLYLVGGAVRDLLLGGAPTDLDLVLEGDVAALASSLGGSVRSHERFGTSTVLIDAHSYDIARARTERYSHPGALPDVSPASLEEDLPRRDFTVNALAIALSGPNAGELVAPAGVLEDLEARRLRVFHDRSFLDDPTRLLRLARYQSRLGFEIEPGTRALALAAVRGDALSAVSRDRVDAELALLAREPDAVAALEAARELGIPYVAAFDATAARRALELLPDDGDRPALLLKAASGSPAVAELAAALARAQKPSEVAQAAGDATVEELALAGATGPVEQAKTWLLDLRQIGLEISGRELLEAGIPAGPQIGKGLQAAYEAKLDGRVHGRDDELAEALRAAR